MRDVEAIQDVVAQLVLLVSAAQERGFVLSFDIKPQKQEGASESSASPMRVILEYNLPESQSDFTRAYHGTDYFLVLSALDNDLRGAVKYGASLDHGATLSEAQREEYEKVRNHLFELCEDHGVSLYDD